MQDRHNILSSPRPAGELETINRLMREKYGLADRYIGFLFSRDDSIPIRLEGQPT